MLESLEVIAKTACTKCGVGLYDLEVINTQHGKVLCVYITKVNGVNITDCSRVAKELNPVLDAQENLIDGAYTLEVSSPGLERPLKFKKHYMSAINEQIKVTHSINEKKESVIGKLIEVNHDFVVLEDGEDTINIPFHNIKKARTCYQMIKKESK